MNDVILDFLEAVTTVYRSYQARRHPLRFSVGPVSRKREGVMPLDIQIYDVFSKVSFLGYAKLYE